MPQAWMIRESERQQLLEGIRSRVYHWADELDGMEVDTVLIQLSVWLSLRLLSYITSFPEFVPTNFDQRIFSLARVIEGDIGRLSRSDIERRQLISVLSVSLLKSGINRFSHELNRQEMDNPRLIFGVDSRTAQVNLSDVRGE